MIKGYKRSRGVYGIRNHIIALSTVACVNTIVEQIAELDDAVIPVTHQHGCDHVQADVRQIVRTLAGLCSNPNVGGVIIIGLGCESVTVKDVVRRINKKGRIVKSIIVQKAGSKKNILNLAKKFLADIKEFLARQKPQPFDISNLVVGLECGGSDPFSAITANPAVGLVSDMLVKLGATVILAETPEMPGAQKILEGRIPDKAVKCKLFARIENYVQTSREFGCDLLGVNPTPGNIRSGISTIEEKSLGCVAKAGTSLIRGFLEYAEKPKSRGLVVMDTPGNDPESLTGLAAGGAHLILFTTGLGTPLGCPVAPVIKISSNTKTYKRMKDFIDIDGGGILNGWKLPHLAESLFSFVVEVCNGKNTASEVNGSNQIAINRLGPTF